MDQVTIREYEQLAHMELVDTPQIHMASVLGVSEGRISQILSEPAYQEIKQRVAAKTVHEHRELNDRWKTIELNATKNIIDTLKFNRDPDFNLKAAIAANRADRRGGQIAPIQANRNMRGTINIPTVMVQMIKATNNTLVINQREPQERAMNRFDVMLPGKVEEILDNKVEEDALEGILQSKLKAE